MRKPSVQILQHISNNIYIHIWFDNTYCMHIQYPIQDHIVVQLNLDCRYLHPKKNKTSNWWIDACSSGSNMFKPFWTLLALICSNFESLHFTQSAVAQVVRSNASVHHFDAVDHCFATYSRRIQAWWTDELWDGNRIGKNRTWNDLAVVSIWGMPPDCMSWKLYHSRTNTANTVLSETSWKYGTSITDSW